MQVELAFTSGDDGTKKLRDVVDRGTKFLIYFATISQVRAWRSGSAVDC